MERSIYFTYISNGSPFIFRTEKMTRHPFKGRGATMLQVHALLTLEGKKTGQSVDVLDVRGQPLNREELEFSARTGNIPESRVPVYPY